MQGGNSKPDISGLQTQVLCHLFHCDDPLLARTQRIYKRYIEYIQNMSGLQTQVVSSSPLWWSFIGQDPKKSRPEAPAEETKGRSIVSLKDLANSFKVPLPSRDFPTSNHTYLPLYHYDQDYQQLLEDRGRIENQMRLYWNFKQFSELIQTSISGTG